MNHLEIYDLNNETVELYKSCFDKNGSPKKTENIKWQFFHDKQHGIFVDILYDTESNRTAAIYAISCVRFRVGKTILIGAQSLDTIVDINYRGKGYFLKLAKDVYEKAKNNDVALVYGFPNGDSIRGFISRKLSWKALDPVPFLIKPLKTRYFTKRFKWLSLLPNVNLTIPKIKLKNKYIIKEENTFTDEVNNVWSQFSKNIEVAVERDKEYLEWRYVDKPNENYTVAHCLCNDGNYHGFIVFTVKQKHDGIIGYIMELIYDTSKPMVGKILLKHAIEKIKINNADCILSWSLEHSPSHSIYKSECFFTMPEKLRPIELHFAVRNFREDLDPILYNRDNWYISYSDSDTV